MCGMKDYTRPVQVNILRWESHFLTRQNPNRQGGTTDKTIRTLVAITSKGKSLQFKSGGFAVLTYGSGKKGVKGNGRLLFIRIIYIINIYVVEI
jgi:hypothetical protein